MYSCKRGWDSKRFSRLDATVPTLRAHTGAIEIPVPHLKSSHQEHHMDQHV